MERSQAAPDDESGRCPAERNHGDEHREEDDEELGERLVERVQGKAGNQDVVVMALHRSQAVVPDCAQVDAGRFAPWPESHHCLGRGGVKRDIVVGPGIGDDGGGGDPTGCDPNCECPDSLSRDRVIRVAGRSLGRLGVMLKAGGVTSACGEELVVQS